jgi:outer membrane biosynthesis protein TonB
MKPCFIGFTLMNVYGAARQIATERPGLIGSLLLHALAAFLLLQHMSSPILPPAALRIIPVDMIELARETISPSAPTNAVPQQPQAAAPNAPRNIVPQQRRATVPVPPREPVIAQSQAAIPNALNPAEPSPSDTPTNALQAKLEALSKLRQPDSDARLRDGAGVSNQAAGNNGARRGDVATYSVRDYVRAQVVRHWNLNLEELGDRNAVVAIHVVLNPDGTLVKAEIVDDPGLNKDAILRSIALSARNAVILSAPFTFPAGGIAPDATDMVLTLNPRDVLR